MPQITPNVQADFVATTALLTVALSNASSMVVGATVRATGVPPIALALIAVMIAQVQTAPPLALAKVVASNAKATTAPPNARGKCVVIIALPPSVPTDVKVTDVGTLARANTVQATALV
jgi:hypothetical protein